MPKHDLHDGIAPANRSSPAVSTTVTEALTPADRSLPVALCRATTEFARGESPVPTGTLESAVSSLEAVSDETALDADTIARLKYVTVLPTQYEEQE
ncbi:hypothetical protein [Natrononativus amylolyticus]|uniref:hypothetical protein n=1 Tax=Natrononativus amylolyticus TaxID=2963434 RepID=UPI0020CE46CD|nr:hypothetical protein [Natrononativus amylolyticus]